MGRIVGCGRSPNMPHVWGEKVTATGDFNQPAMLV